MAHKASLVGQAVMVNQERSDQVVNALGRFKPETTIESIFSKDASEWTSEIVTKVRRALMGYAQRKFMLNFLVNFLHWAGTGGLVVFMNYRVPVLPLGP